jgi:hypothetical protein
VNGGEVQGTLVVPFREDDGELVICQAAPCSGPAAPGARTLVRLSVRSLEVWGRKGNRFALYGVFAGALAGALADGEDGGLLLVAGVFAGGALGWLAGSGTEGWNPVFPCRHGCAWEVAPAASP